MPSAANLPRHLAAVLSVQSSRRAISLPLTPSAASSTTFARITSRCARVYCPARRRNSRSSASLKVIAASAITSRIRRAYGNSSRTYLREPVLATGHPVVERAPPAEEPVDALVVAGWYRHGGRRRERSYRTLRYLVQRLPVMIAPAWLRTATQPIGINDVIE
jgi:hypothetical protein